MRNCCQCRLLVIVLCITAISRQNAVVDARCIMVRGTRGEEVQERANAFVCPRNCQCSKSMTEVDCRDRKHQTVPDNLPPRIVTLQLARNNISHLTVTDFAGCRNLTYLEVSFNQIEHVDVDTFADNVNLRNLLLSKNRINFGLLPAGAFRGLNKLTNLKMDHNKWDPSHGYRGDLFANLTQLVYLQLDGITDVAFPKEFSRLKKLKEFTVCRGLEAIRNDTFAVFNHSAIKKLDIDTRAVLRTLEPMSFAYFRELNELDLGYNRNLGFVNASRAWWGLQFTRVQSIVLTSITPDEDKSTEITAEFYRYLNLTQLKSLLLDRNGITRIEPRLSQSLPNLRYLKLKENRLANADELIDDCARLKHLVNIDVSYQLFPAPLYHLTGEEVQSEGETTSPDPNDDGVSSLEYGRTKRRYPIPPCVRDGGLKPCPVKSRTAPADLFELSLPGTNFRLDSDPICVAIAPNLESVDLTEALSVPLHTLPQTIIFGGKHLKFIVLDSNSIERIVGPIIFTEPPTGLAVYLRDNHITCLTADLFNNSLSNGTEVKWLMLSKNNLGEQLDRDTRGRTFQYYRHLERLELNANAIKNLTRRVFHDNANLKELHLSQNSLRQIEFEFDHMTNLSFLDLSFNLFASLNATLMDKFSRRIARNGSNFTINMNGNPLQCSCETLDFLRWTELHQKRLMNFPKYSCLFKGQYVTFNRLSSHIMLDLQFECSKKTAMIVAGSLLGLALLSITLSVFCYRHRWEIRYACLRLTQRGRRYQQLVNEPPEYEYDAFVIYDYADRDWVNNQLVPHLERLEDGPPDANGGDRVQNDYRCIRLCVHERDFPLGEEILTNIWNRMERSRRVIAVISNNFTTSQYCEYELVLARMQSVERCRNMLVPVLLELPDVNHVSACLHWVLRKLTYIQWPLSEGEQDDFWNAVHDALLNDVDGGVFRQQQQHQQQQHGNA